MKKILFTIVLVAMMVTLVGCDWNTPLVSIPNPFNAAASSTPTQVVVQNTPTPQPARPTQAPTSAPTLAPTATPKNDLGKNTGRGAVVTTVQSSKDMGKWKIEYLTGATTLMKNFEFTDPDRTWAEFPNVDWPPHSFLAKNGVEYGQDLNNLCQQDGYCDFPVAARSYWYFTGDFSIAGIGSCNAENGIGCAVIIINMGDVTAEFLDQQLDKGFSLTGLYWNGDEADQAISALASHISYRMIGVPGNNPANPGANCSIPNGCSGVDMTFVILSGNELLVKGHTIVK